MKGEKRYLQPFDMLLNAIHDLAGLQKAKTLLSDSSRGIIHLLITIYETEREYRFTVTDAGGRRSDVTVELSGEEQAQQRLITHEFALLDYMLLDRAKIEFTKIEIEGEKIHE